MIIFSCYKGKMDKMELISIGHNDKGETILRYKDKENIFEIEIELKTQTLIKKGIEEL